MAWIPKLLLALFLLSGCAHDRHQYFEKLSPESRSEYAKYEQFMTERQKDTYLMLPGDRERSEFVRDLHVEDRLARWPGYVQEAIWSRRVVPGMDAEAVILAWGAPEAIERAYDHKDKGVERRVWRYRDGSRAVYFLDDKVVEVDE